MSAFLKGKTPWWRVPKPPNMGEVRIPIEWVQANTGRCHLRLAPHPAVALCRPDCLLHTAISHHRTCCCTAPVLQVRSIQQLVNELDEHKNELVVVEVGHCQ